MTLKSIKRKIMDEKPNKVKVEKETPKKPESEVTPKEPQPEKTGEEKDEQIKTLQAQKEHFRSKSEKAEGEVTQLKEDNEQLQEKLKSSAPSDAEMRKKHADWDLLDEGERKSRIRQAALEKDMVLVKEKQAWDEDFKKLKEDPRFENISESEFKKFAYKYPKEVDLETLAKSFLFEKGESGANEDSPPKRPGLEKVTPGRETPKEKGYTIEDMQRMRENEPKRYEKLNDEGAFKNVKFEVDE